MLLLTNISRFIAISRFAFKIIGLRFRHSSIYVLTRWRSKGKNQGLKNNLLLRLIIASVRIAGGKIYSVPGIQAPLTKPLLERLSPEGAKKMSKLEKRAKGQEIVVRQNDWDKIVFSDEHEQFLKSQSGVTNKIYNVGIPRLYSSWQAHVKRYGQIDYEETLKELKVPPSDKKVIQFWSQSRLCLV